MSEKKDCKIVQDLLPNYIEKLTNEETNNYIESHLSECKECKIVLENMEKELKTNVQNRDKREVDYIKKFRNKMKFLKLILLTIVVVYVIIVLRKAIIMTELGKRAEKYEYDVATNYYCKIYNYDANSIQIAECYRLGEDYLGTILYNSNSQDMKITYYKKEDEKINLLEINGEKRLLKHEISYPIPINKTMNNFFINLREALFVRIESTYCNGRECYIIKEKWGENYVDKETGILVRWICKSNKDEQGKRDTIQDCQYRFDVVKDSDIIKPDISGYVET